MAASDGGLSDSADNRIGPEQSPNSVIKKSVEHLKGLAAQHPDCTPLEHSTYGILRRVQVSKLLRQVLAAVQSTIPITSRSLFWDLRLMASLVAAAFSGRNL